MLKTPRVLKKNRGVAILLALFFMILLSLIGIALIGMVPVELQSSTRTKLDVQAHYTVTAGIRHARSWCSAVMTPSSDPLKPDFLGDDATTTGNIYYNPGGSYYNEITGVNGGVPSVEYTAMQLDDVYDSTLIPTSTARWSNVYKMLNIPETGDTHVDGATVVLVKKQPLVLGDWSAYTVIIPDADTPGGANTLDPSKTKITTFFGGSGKAGRRCYQIVTLAYYQGFPTLRGKSTILEDSFARYSLFVADDPSGTWALQALPGQATTLGPVHTNKQFHFAINPGVWTDSSGTVPFNGLLTFGTYADAATGVNMSLNHDGNLYSEGNDNRGTMQNYRPFDDLGNEVSNRYSKMIAGGKSNLRQTAPVSLPPDSTKIANAAYGTSYSTGLYSGTASAHFMSQSRPGNPSKPDGIFVFTNPSNKAAGGVVVKSDQKDMFLEVVDINGKPLGVTNTLEIGSLESGALTGNPAIRAQGEQVTNEVTTTTTGTTLHTSLSSTPVTIGSTTGTTVSSSSTSQTPTSTRTTYRTTTSRSSTSTGTSLRYFTTRISSSTSTGTSLSYLTTVVSNSTSTGSNVQYFTTTSVSSSSTGTNVTYFSTSTLTTYSTSYTTIGQAGGIVQTVYLTSYNTITTSTRTGTLYRTTTLTNTTSTRTNTLYSTGFTTNTTSTSTRTLFSTTTTTSTTSTSTRTLYSTTTFTTTTSTQYNTLYRTLYSTWYPTTTSYITSISTTTSTSTETNLTVNVATESYFPVDQLIEARNVGVSLNPTMFAANGTSNYRLPAGAVGSAASMDVSKLGGITLYNSDGTTPLSATTVPTGNVVVIKQSRLDPTKALVFIVPADANSEGALLNGAVYHEANIGDTSGTKEGGVAGVNYGRKTIGGQVPPQAVSGSYSVTNSADPFASQPIYDGNGDGTPDVAVLGIGNNLWQYGTSMKETDTSRLKAEHGLGLVAQDVRINARTDDFLNFADGHAPNYTTDTMLNIHAVILAGSSTGGGGLTVKGFTNINDITPTNVNSAIVGQTPLARFIGGLILQNYYPRVNGIEGAGWNSMNIYNQQLALKPPPYFPNNGLLIPLSYVEERIWGDQKI